MYGIQGLSLCGRSWWSVSRTALKEYYPHLKDVPGARVTTDPDGTPLSATIHLTHLPLLPGYTPSAARQIPPDVPRVQWEWLRVYQQNAVMIARERQGILLADDLGLGKTATATAAAQLPVMVMCPASAIYVWEKECKRLGWTHFTFKAGVDRLEARERYTVNPPNCWIVPYSMAPRLVSDFHPHGPAPDLTTLIADEAHIMSRGGVRASRAAAMTSATVRIALTATPMRSHLSSLWGILNMIAPGAFGTHWDFRKRYCSATENSFGGLDDGAPSNTDELTKRVGVILIKRTREEVGHEIPPLNRTVEFVKPDHAKLREAVEATASSAQIAVESALRREIGRQKREAAHKTLLDLRRSYNRIVVWFWHKHHLEWLYERCAESLLTIPKDVMTGDSPTKRRARILDEWENGNPEDPRLLFATIGAGATAISLTTAQAALFVEYDWTPLNVVQAEKRHHRFGNTHGHVRAHYLTLEGTDDERMLNVLLYKADSSEKILGRDGQVKLIETLMSTAQSAAPVCMDRIWERL